MLNDFTQQQQRQLGIRFVLDNLSLQNVFGIEKKRNIEWMSNSNKADLLRELGELGQWVDFQKTHPEQVEKLKIILNHFKEIRGILRKLERENEILSETELFDLKNFAIDMENLRAAFNTCAFDFEKYTPIPAVNIIEILNPDSQVSRSFAIQNEYSPKLAEIRRKKNILEKEIAGKPEDHQHLLQRRNEIVEKEREEEIVVKKELGKKLFAYLDDFFANIRFIAELDFVIAKASLAIEFNCTAPRFRESDMIDIKNTFNPYVASILDKDGKHFTPISLCLKAGANVLTGANMGGKTVALSTITLNIILAHCGFFVFAESMILPILDYIFYLGHSGQSVSDGLSSFGAEVMEVTELIEAMKSKKGFCALDEFARTTNPDEGRLMGRALLKFTEKYQSFCLFSTHLNEVVMEGMNHFQVVGLKNANLESLSITHNGESVKTLQELMDFTIENVGWNSPPPQDAIRVAELLGVQTDFLDLVRNFYKEQ